jgi:hypothetical protein
LLIASIDKQSASGSPLASAFIAAGFTPSSAGLALRRSARNLDPVEDADDSEASHA